MKTKIESIKPDGFSWHKNKGINLRRTFPLRQDSYAANFNFLEQ